MFCADSDGIRQRQEIQASKANLCVHIGTIHINLSSVRVDDIDNVLDFFFEYAKRTRYVIISAESSQSASRLS